MVHEIEISVLVDENGDAVAACDASTLGELYENDIGNDPALARRIVTIKLSVEVSPAVVLSAVVPADGHAATMEVCVP
jgi:hypothetical protein